MNLDTPETNSISLPQYRELLRNFDAVVCEALAIGQAASNRLEAPHVGYTTIIFARLCSYAQSLVRAAPMSRWSHTDAEHWEFAAVAGHARAIMEGFLLMTYISKEPETPDEWSARLNVMHLNDCTRRIRLFTALEDEEQKAALEIDAVDLRGRLRGNPWFLSLSQKRQNDLLSGQPLTISSREQQIEAAGLNKKDFDAMWMLFSQYAHVLPLSFYRMESNGRGTGMKNDTDMMYIAGALDKCGLVMTSAVDRMVELFPDTEWARQGINSKFSPGPRANLPRHVKRRLRT